MILAMQQREKYTHNNGRAVFYSVHTKGLLIRELRFGRSVGLSFEMLACQDVSLRAGESRELRHRSY
jgi:hypothetical protein